MKRVFITFFCMFIFLHAQQKNADFTKQVIRKNEIENAGYSRISDLLYLINSNALINYDGFRSSMSLSANPLNINGWRLLIDGSEIDSDYLGYYNFNRLPLNIEQIDSIEVFNKPSLVKGSITNTGVVHIHTTFKENMFSIDGSYSTGNQAGDPGPYQFIFDDTENVDQVGPYISSNFSFNFNRVKGFVGYKDNTHPSTNPRVLKINEDHSFIDRQMRLAGGYARLTSDLFGYHTITMGYSTTLEVPFSKVKGADLVYSEITGDEYPVESKLFHFGITGRHDTEYDLTINYAVNSSINKFKYISGKFYGAAFDYFESDFSLIKLFGKISAEIGFKGYSNSVEQVGLIERHDIYSGYTRISVPIRNGLNELGAAVSHYDGNYMLKIYYDGILHIYDDLLIGVNAALLEEHIAEKPEEVFWLQRGFTIDTMSVTPVNFIDTAPVKKSYDINLFVQKKISDLLKIDLGYKYEQFEYGILPVRRFLFTGEDLVTGFNKFINTNGKVSHFKAVIENKFGNNFKQSLFYSYSFTHSGGNYKLLSQRIPQHNFQFIINYEPVENLFLWLRFGYNSGSYWHDFKGIGSQSNELFTEYLPEMFLLDLSIGKNLWNERIHLNANFRNILNQWIQYYPVGANFPLKFSIKAKVDLGIL